MSSSKAARWAMCACAAASPVGAAQLSCPVLPDTRERHVQLFDGAPSEQVSLIADQGDARRGSWKVGYVYDQGRALTLQCVYANRATRDIAIPGRVDVCRYRTDSAGLTKLDCE
ncbi:STY0301 family protein [Caballeronia sp. LZ034LL]|uniref:STY0301 family protein n=1 Tax=Caballeronia sp. LZ034LL TaxID=3038567 RepID=UPI00285ADB16|nr:STY0301 family protein [Caballeronia sp. LZ034LL]MDR5837713.1 hypothetical protein [Caballeronia sp. LZ034LL]